MSIKQLVVILSLIGAIVGAAWALDARYTPREVTNLLIADLQHNQLLIQNNTKIQNAQNWLMFWTMKVNTLEQECQAQPSNPTKQIELNNAKRQRDRWQNEVNRLMNE